MEETSNTQEVQEEQPRFRGIDLISPTRDWFAGYDDFDYFG